MTSTVPLAEIPDDPFEGLDDQGAAAPQGTVSALLKDTKRGYVPLRNEFVQKHDGPIRASVLADLVTGRHHRPLDALLFLHALQPILAGSPLRLGTWARALSTRSPCTPNAVSKAFGVLETLNLVSRETGPGSRTTVVELLMETRSKDPWSRPGQVSSDRYFTIPHAYWTTGLADQLTLPGKAMFLIMLKETQDPNRLTFSMAVERAFEWYGISERTAERGYTELRKANVLLTRVVKVTDHRHPAGRREVYHRALARPFGTKDRAALQEAAMNAARQSDPTVEKPNETS